jgi:hypothetical protein
LGTRLWPVCCPAAGWSHPHAPAQLAGFTEESAVGLRLVPHALELRGSGEDTATTVRLARVRRNRAARWLPALGWVWKRAKLAAKDNDPERVAKLARIRGLAEDLRSRQVLRLANELDIHLLPKSGYQWMKEGTQLEVMTPGQNEKRYWAGAWDLRTGPVHHCVGARQTNGLFRNLLETGEAAYPARR